MVMTLVAKLAVPVQEEAPLVMTKALNRLLQTTVEPAGAPLAKIAVWIRPAAVEGEVALERFSAATLTAEPFRVMVREPLL
jgi:hypothetical protein